MKRIVPFTLLALTACPQDDVFVSDESSGVDPTAVSNGTDLPSMSNESDSGTTTSTSGDEDGDGDGESEDGDGDTGSEAVPASLIVESNGQRIGYLMGVWDFGFSVWDDVNEVAFQLNQLTGHVVGSPGYGYFTTANCTGVRYEQATYVPTETCGQIGASIRRVVRGENIPIGGHVAAPNLTTTNGQAVLVNIQSVQSSGNCAAYAAQLCVYAMQPTNVIPKTFPLPITVSETVVMP
jgi:hypothetical protein